MSLGKNTPYTADQVAPEETDPTKAASAEQSLKALASVVDAVKDIFQVEEQKKPAYEDPTSGTAIVERHHDTQVASPTLADGGTDTLQLTAEGAESLDIAIDASNGDVDIDVSFYETSAFSSAIAKTAIVTAETAKNTHSVNVIPTPWVEITVTDNTTDASSSSYTYAATLR